MRVDLTPANERVYEVWRFCGGWRPELIPMAAMYYGIDDVAFVIEQMIAIRDRLARKS